MFVGRKAELEFLKSQYERKGGSLVVLYGRRRVGKTETLREFCKGKKHVFFSCTQVTDRIQLRNFSQRLLTEKVPASQYVSEFEDWEKAFRAISDLPYGNEKKLVVIDEFPYMCQGNKGIPSILQNLWDSQWKDENVMIVLCGSTMSFIEKELLAERNPLYGRATGIYKMTEMGFYDSILFFPGYSAKDKVLAYSILGGVPHYLRQFDPNRTLEENIKRHILSKGSALYSEVDFLLHQELRETPIYNSIIEAVALGNTRLNEISQKALIQNTAKTSVYLKNLIELGIVKREFSVDAKIRVNLSRGFYRLTDSYFRFWYNFCFSNFSQLEDGDVEGVYEFVVKPSLQEYASLVFEDVCQEFVRMKQKKKQLPFRFDRLGRWRGKTTIRNFGTGELKVAETEIDMLGIGKDEKEYLVGECKFKNKPFSYKEYLETLAKLTPLKEQAKFYYALFSESGFDFKIVAEAEENNTSLYSLEDIVHASEE